MENRLKKYLEAKYTIKLYYYKQYTADFDALV